MKCTGLKWTGGHRRCANHPSWLSLPRTCEPASIYWHAAGLEKSAFEEKTVCDLPQESNLLVHAKETGLIGINGVWQNIFLAACQRFGEGFIASSRKQ